MKVQVTIRSVYGRELIYPVNDTALKFAQLIGRKTFEHSHLDVIKTLGYEIELINTYGITI